LIRNQEKGKRKRKKIQGCFGIKTGAAYFVVDLMLYNFL